jgi:hypothetical protein
MPLTIRIPTYDETLEVEDGGYVTMREPIADTDTPATQITTPPATTVFDEMTFPLAPPRLVRQRAVVLTPTVADHPIRSLLGDDIPVNGEPLEPLPVATAAPAVRAPGGFGMGFGPAPELPGWANGYPPYEPHDLNNPYNPNRYYWA